MLLKKIILSAVVCLTVGFTVAQTDRNATLEKNKEAIAAAKAEKEKLTAEIKEKDPKLRADDFKRRGLENDLNRNKARLKAMKQSSNKENESKIEQKIKEEKDELIKLIPEITAQKEVIKKLETDLARQEKIIKQSEMNINNVPQKKHKGSGK